MINASNLRLQFGAQTIFDDISFTVQSDQRIGLVGRNGSGKSTMLAALTNPRTLDGGRVSIVRGSTIAYMPQNVVLESEQSILDEAYSAHAKIIKLQKQEAELDVRMHDNPTPEEIDAYAQVHEQLALLNPEHALANTKRMLAGLGFSQKQFTQSVNTLSVGWKMRIVLAKLLLQDADFYLFDEPTNHLDLVAKEWFLNFLKTTSFGFMLVCHERYFIDELCTDILELEMGKANWYSGDYSRYETQKEEKLARLIAAQSQQQKEMKRKRATAERFRARASKAKMAQSILRSLDKIELIELPPMIRDVSFSFPPVKRAGRIVLTAENVAQKFGEKKIFENVSFEIERGQKVGVVAPNGAGKTTLFNLIVGQLPLQTGSIEQGYNVESAIFAQDQNKFLNGETSVIENVKNLCSHKSEQVIRSMLGAFLFGNDDVKKKVKVLSGGEKNRVGMVVTLLQDANLLLLDEPTNHLDIPSKKILLKALREYQGTMLFVSHDRDFVNDLSSHIIELTANGAHMYHGNYDSYVQQAAHAKPQTSKAQSSTATEEEKSHDAFEARKMVRKLESAIEKLEKEIARVEMSFADHEYGTPGFTQAQERLTELQKKLKEKTKAWEQATKEAQ